MSLDNADNVIEGGRPFRFFLLTIAHGWVWGFGPSGQMVKHIIRHYGHGHLHFMTFSCYRRLPLLPSVRARNAMIQILADVRDRYGFSLVGFVLMPEHVHLLISEPARGTPSTVVQVLKQRVSHRLRHKTRCSAAQLSLGFQNGEETLPRFWQRRFYDFKFGASRSEWKKFIVCT